MKNWSEARGSATGSHRLHEVRTNNITLQEDIFAILENGSVETMLRGAMEVECKPSSKHLADEIKNKDDLLTLRSCARTFISDATMQIIESLVVLERLIPRGNQSVTSRANGRRASFVERRLRLVAAPRERSGCSPASPPPEGTSWPSSRCIGPDGSPVGGAQQLRLPWFGCYIRV